MDSRNTALTVNSLEMYNFNKNTWYGVENQVLLTLLLLRCSSMALSGSCIGGAPASYSSGVNSSPVAPHTQQVSVASASIFKTVAAMFPMLGKFLNYKWRQQKLNRNSLSTTAPQTARLKPQTTKRYHDCNCIRNGNVKSLGLSTIRKCRIIDIC